METVEIRTPHEIKSAVERLTLNKVTCQPISFFGDDNLAKIDVTIDVIENDRDETYVYSKYPSTDAINHYKFRSAISALSYMRGEIEIEDLIYPDK